MYAVIITLVFSAGYIVGITGFGLAKLWRFCFPPVYRQVDDIFAPLPQTPEHLRPAQDMLLDKKPAEKRTISPAAQRMIDQFDAEMAWEDSLQRQQAKLRREIRLGEIRSQTRQRSRLARIVTARARRIRIARQVKL